MRSQPASGPDGNGQARTGGPADDDPLTSPSFPAINAADSRSYRTRRSANSQPGISGPNGYPAQSAALQPTMPHAPSATSPPAASASPRQSPAEAPSAPAANPYGSYVSTPQPAYQQPTHHQPAYPDAPTRGRTAADYAGYPATPRAAAGGTWYSPAALEPGGAGGPTAADGYLPTASLNGSSRTGDHGHAYTHNGSAPRGYAGIDYSSLRYDDPVYPDAQAGGLVGYATPEQPTAQYDQHAYGGPDLGYSQDGYQGYPGYGADRR